MKTFTEKEVKNLSGADWNRIHRALRKKFVSFDSGNIANIAFGAKREKGCICSGHTKYVRFLVRYKRTPRARIDRIDRQIPVEFRHGKSRKLVRVLIPTDVEEVGKIVLPTGASVADNLTGDIAGTTGLPIDVAHEAFGQTIHTRGFVTVGHPFESVSVPRDVTGKRRDSDSRSVPGRIRKRSFPRKNNSKFDGAFAETSHKDLREGNYLVSDGASTSTLSENEMRELADNRETGVILRYPPKGPANIIATDYIPETLPDFDSEFQVMRGVLRGEAEQGGVLFVGTSGSIWRFRDQVASIQFAAEEGFRFGYSQAAFALLHEWLKGRFDATRVRILNSF